MEWQTNSQNEEFQDKATTGRSFGYWRGKWFHIDKALQQAGIKNEPHKELKGLFISIV